VSRFDAWLPKSVTALRHYDARTFVSDLVAGLTVGFVALPLAMAFAISSGVPPQAGLYCAIVAGFLISALGGSRTQIGGPTGAFVVVVSGIIARHGLDGLLTCTVMAGVMLVILGATGMGTAVDYIPRPVIVGFTNGIAVLIASTQIKDLLGLRIPEVSGVFVPRMIQIARALPTLSLPATVLGLLSLVVVLTGNRYVRRVPGTILALFAGTAAAVALRLPIETIGSRFGGVPSGLPHFAPPHLRLALLHPLLAPAITVAMLGAIESLMSAVVADRMTGDRHNPNVELIGQGVANVVTPFFGGLPATGAIARTATSIRTGARTPVAGMVHALTLLAILVFAAPLARFVPLTILAAILLVVAWHMGDWAEIPELLKLSRADISVWLVTFALTVLADLTIAVEFGMILAALLFIRKVAATTTVSEVTREDVASGRVHVLQDKVIPDYVSVFRIHGPFLFGSAEKLDAVAERIDRLAPIVILRLRNMTAIDATGLRAFEDLADRLHATGRSLILCGAREQPARLMDQAEFDEHIGHANICSSIQHALERAAEIQGARRPSTTAHGTPPA
jgi:sulfate permease, SulP family